MNRLLTANVLGIAILVASGCNSQPGEQSANEANVLTPAEQQDARTPDLNSLEMPPMVVRSPSYRCDDGKALYVDVLADKSGVLVRDTRADIPTKLASENEGGPYAGEERTLSGTGSEVRYSSPDRPSQSCREAAV